MRILSLVVLVACTVTNPDPRQPKLATMEQGGLGGWIVLTSYDPQVPALAGELISVEPALVRVRTADARLVSVARGDIWQAKLYPYASESGFGAWGVAGSVSTLSHGLWAVFSLPIWVTAASAVAYMESRHAILSYPDKSWDELSKWARFPQGLPVGIDQAALQ